MQTDCHGVRDEYVTIVSCCKQLLSYKASFFFALTGINIVCHWLLLFERDTTLLFTRLNSFQVFLQMFRIVLTNTIHGIKML